MLQIRRKKPMMKLDYRNCDIKWTRKVIGILVIFCSFNLAISSSSSHSAKYSAPLNNNSEDDFKPIIFTHMDSELIASQQFTKTGQYRIFEPIESDLRLNRKEFTRENETDSNSISSEARKETHPFDEKKNKFNNMLDSTLNAGLKHIEDRLSSYLDEFFARKEIEKFGIAVKVNGNSIEDKNQELTNENKLGRNLKRLVRNTVVNVPLPRAAETGRFFLFAGLKKILWPLFIGVQIIKSLIFALFLPSIIGSIGKIATQGSSSIAGFNKPSETVNDLNFKDNFEDDNKYMVDNAGYAYNQPEPSTNHFSTQLYDSAALNNNALSRFGINNNRNNYLNTFGYDENKKANLNPDSPSLAQLYQSFKKLPSSSLVLSNYDPFYSPLLSRLDAIFEQLGLKSKDENCREKLICFMYADPQKYAPYSNLVSAQLSRELDELKKPTSENPEILRFFRYMKAAKDGQDGDKCDETYSMCENFKDFDNPAMINAFHDINKLVEARKLLK
ncbi:uncharacterized protein LOC129916457 [Episyrphus balteatus]|uniref:uncharacterized protein LOC129916457 n=1 Tax=Episyrphus balteatus TaxID=286459 RepID=UPI00248565EA|nr:uncharacterized protein LOC129916457 [Episyrphus balteatus]